MNERIRAIAQESEVSRGGMRVVDIEKFAELIVREAMTVTKDYTCNQGWDYSAPVALARHFGVKS